MNEKIPSRFRIIGLIFTFLGVSIIFQMLRVSTSAKADDIVKGAESFQYVERWVYPPRGNIYDRWGNLLAGNKQVYELGVELLYVTNPETIASTLNSVLGMDYKSVLDKASMDFERGKAEYVRLTDFVTTDKIEQIQQIKQNYANNAANLRLPKDQKAPSLRGLVWEPHFQRTYPEGTLAANVLGFYKFLDRIQGVGFYGVEEKYETLLAAPPFKVLVPQDPNQIDLSKIPMLPQAADIILTIDREMQSSVEKILESHVKSNGAVNGTAIVIDPKTGEILAMATVNRINPNTYWEYPDFTKGTKPFNPAVGQILEPGSVFKVLTMVIGLDSGAVKPETTMLDTGVYEISGARIRNWDSIGHGRVNMTQCMQLSLNVCLSWVVEQVGAPKFYAYLKAFGIDHRTSIDLAGEVNLNLPLPGDPYWHNSNQATNSFGQGLAITPIQLVMAVSAVANDGKMMAPHVLKAVAENGRQVLYRPQVIGTPVSAEASRTLTAMLAQSVEAEARNRATVPGYRIAGKTGTGQIPTKTGYDEKFTNASFIGWGPIDDPRFVVYVWFEKPTSSIWGSEVASPAFRDIVKSIVGLMDLPPDNIRKQMNQ